MPNFLYRQIGTEVACKGNGMTLGVYNGTDNGGFYATSNNGYTNIHPDSFGKSAGSSSSGSYFSSKTLGITLDKTKSGIIADTSDLITSNMIIKY